MMKLLFMMLLFFQLNKMPKEKENMNAFFCYDTEEEQEEDSENEELVA
jgi:hypothetical protein